MESVTEFLQRYTTILLGGDLSSQLASKIKKGEAIDID